jgi:hypothetical protein
MRSRASRGPPLCWGLGEFSYVVLSSSLTDFQVPGEPLLIHLGSRSVRHRRKPRLKTSIALSLFLEAVEAPPHQTKLPQPRGRSALSMARRRFVGVLSPEAMAAIKTRRRFSAPTAFGTLCGDNAFHSD